MGEGLNTNDSGLSSARMSFKRESLKPGMVNTLVNNSESSENGSPFKSPNQSFERKSSRLMSQMNTNGNYDEECRL